MGVLVFNGVGHLRAYCVVHESGHVDRDLPLLERLLQEPDDLLPDAVPRLKPLRPVHQVARVDRGLFDGERKREAQLEIGRAAVLGAGRLADLVGNEPEQVGGALARRHELGRDSDLARLHEAGALSRLQVKRDNAKVGAAEVEREKRAALAARGEAADVGRKHLDLGPRGGHEAALHLDVHAAGDILEDGGRAPELRAQTSERLVDLAGVLGGPDGGGRAGDGGGGGGGGGGRRIICEERGAAADRRGGGEESGDGEAAGGVVGDTGAGSGRC